ncbi:hypothetical protein QB607_003031 [Clostridium botulinum]|nr:hypothetical protein [Clostridium botulinum]EKS4395705.1 hypothetical protein [Clostridium botulinum]
MKNEKKVGFSYGVFGDSLEKQANDQGFTLNDNAEKFEKIRRAINMCGFHVATESQVDSMLKKLHKQILKSLETLSQEE